MSKIAMHYISRASSNHPLDDCRNAYNFVALLPGIGVKGKKGKDIPVAGLEGPQDCETSRLPHFLNNRLTDGGKIVSLTRWLLFTPQEDSWYSFLLQTESTPGPIMRLEGLGKLKRI
jgi:hypothetical protein